MGGLSFFFLSLSAPAIPNYVELAERNVQLGPFILVTIALCSNIFLGLTLGALATWMNNDLLKD